MDKELLNKILNSNLNEHKINIVQRLFDNSPANSFVRGSDELTTPTPKSQNHSNTINNSLQSQDAIQSMLNKLNAKKDESNN